VTARCHTTTPWIFTRGILMHFPPPYRNHSFKILFDIILLYKSICPKGFCYSGIRIHNLQLSASLSQVTCPISPDHVLLAWSLENQLWKKYHSWNSSLGSIFITEWLPMSWAQMFSPALKSLKRFKIEHFIYLWEIVIDKYLQK